MKRAYTVFSSPLKAMAKKMGLSENELYRAVTLDADAARASENPEWMQIHGTACGMRVCNEMTDLGSVHIFLPSKEFSEWLVGCVPQLEVQHAKVFQNIGGDDVVKVLHFPSATRLTSVACKVAKNCEYLDGGKAPDFAMMSMIWSSSDNHGELGSINVCLDTNGKCSEAAMFYVKLVVGIGMYASCFPEAVKDGVPEDLKHPSFHQYKQTFSITESDTVKLGGTHESPHAHYRRGHFRCLKSTSFTHKRFQVVFVREAFVKGRAKTIIPIDILP